LNNSSQLAGFAKRDDLSFFLEELCGAEYLHEPLLAPTRDILDAYRKGRGDGRVREALSGADAGAPDRGGFGQELFEEAPTALLCSEAGPERCHRRLVLEYLDREWGGIRAVHL
jgi:hypothetical protein